MSDGVLIESLRNKLDLLVEEQRIADGVLKMALSLNDYSLVMDGSATVESILKESSLRLESLMDMGGLAFYLIRDAGAEFYRAWCDEESHIELIEDERRALVEDGTFAWALNRTKPVVVSGRCGKRIILHVLATPSRIMGMFIGILDSGNEAVPEVILSFLTMLLNSTANVLQNLDLYGMVRSLNVELQNKVDRLTESEHQLRKYKENLEEEVIRRTRELARTNERLRGEMEERKHAEEKIRQGYKRLGRTLNGIIDAAAIIVETRDPYTAGHQRRVSRLAFAIAGELGLSKGMAEGIRVAGLVHDIGKIHIPAEILIKPGRLSELEYQLVQTHPQSGYEILKNIDFPWPVAETILQHHERIDGSGYPRGLRGEGILLEAKIIAVADVVEAISSHRPYRPSLGLERGLSEIMDNRGRLYDSGAVDACIAIFRKGSFSFESPD